MKPFFIAVIILAILIDFAPWRQSQQDAAQPQEKADNQSSSNGQVRATTKAATSNSETPHWYESPEWVLVIVGIITAFFIGWQSWETRCASEATKINANAFITESRPWLLLNKEMTPDRAHTYWQ